MHRWFPSHRFLTAILLCICYASVQMMNSNMGMAIVCMMNSDDRSENDSRFITTDAFDSIVTFNETEEDIPESYSSRRVPKLRWSSNEQGYVFGAFNVGLLSMIASGFVADRVSAKYMIVAAILTASFANFLIGYASIYSIYSAIAGRVLVGLSDALLQPSVNSLLTRWFPPFERSYALGLVTGGRQIGALVIVPTAGVLCNQTILFGGWPAVFYLSAGFGIAFAIVYALISADKPSKQLCISESELNFIMKSIACEDFGKKRTQRTIEWYPMLTSPPTWAAILSVVCHEYPLMTMIMFLPSYLHDVHHYTATKNGFFSALPTAALWISKITSSYLNTYLLLRTLLKERTKLRRTKICKVLNTIGSVCLAICMYAVTLLDSSQTYLAIVFLCVSMASAGLHAPGCQASLVSIAPAYSGSITGLTFFFVAIVGIINPIVTKGVVKNGTILEWNIIFYIAAIVSLLPVVIFNIWGSSDVQEWATLDKMKTKKPNVPTTICTSDLSTTLNLNEPKLTTA